MKYAIIEHSGKQYLAEEGGRIEVDRLALEVGKPVEFKAILLVSDGKQTEVGSPYVSGAKVKGKVLEHAKSKKITVFKYKPKVRYRRTQGHRQRLTRIAIEDVALPGAKVEAAAGAETKASSAPAKRTTRSAGKQAGGRPKSGSPAAKRSGGAKAPEAGKAKKQGKDKKK